MSQTPPSTPIVLEVRRARDDELADCATLYVKVLRETFTWLPPERHRREEFLRFAEDEEIYVALEDGVIVGLAGFYRPQIFIHSLYVDRRGRGVGRALMAHLRSVTPYALSLKVQTRNLAARAFYAREGFLAVEEGHDPGSGISWIRMVEAS